MHRLITLAESPLVPEIMRRLEEAGIPAQATAERGPAAIYLGGPPRVTVWLARAEDIETASALVEEFATDRVTTNCPNCGYDLQGHAGRTACPECGCELTAASPDVPCPTCGEPVPGDFDVCWSCGGEMG